jgi:predicted DNA-binding transcriptional regulator YafY
VDPYALLFAERWWYLVAFCRDREAVRLFRLDRTLAVECGEERFEPPAGFDAAAHAPGGRAFVAGEALPARVRYGARVARWIRERHPEAAVEQDGSVVLEHAVADPRWLARHVLQYGRDAEVLGPPEMRRLVAEVVRGRTGGTRPAAAGSEVSPDPV